MKQKDVFVQAEGNAWFARNAAAQAARVLPQDDDVLVQILRLPAPGPGANLLEIGFGDGTRLNWLRSNTGYICHGIEPSADAVTAARGLGLSVVQGTAETLPYADKSMDMLVFGFCLYLCDREDLFRIASEADRVLKNPGWLVIRDFYSPVPQKREYHHRSGLFSHKMDYRTLFDWHPGYTCYFHEVRHHATHAVTDDPSEWVATSVLRKNLSV
jgi:ubiquinone/menaquinone biosynthesis C-methylase UbiE